MVPGSAAEMLPGPVCFPDWPACTMFFKSARAARSQAAVLWVRRCARTLICFVVSWTLYMLTHTWNLRFSNLSSHWLAISLACIVVVPYGAAAFMFMQCKPTALFMCIWSAYRILACLAHQNPAIAGYDPSHELPRVAAYHKGKRKKNKSNVKPENNRKYYQKMKVIENKIKMYLKYWKSNGK